MRRMGTVHGMEESITYTVLGVAPLPCVAHSPRVGLGAVPPSHGASEGGIHQQRGGGERRRGTGWKRPWDHTRTHGGSVCVVGQWRHTALEHAARRPRGAIKRWHGLRIVEAECHARRGVGGAAQCRTIRPVRTSWQWDARKVIPVADLMAGVRRAGGIESRTASLPPSPHQTHTRSTHLVGGIERRRPA